MIIVYYCLIEKERILKKQRLVKRIEHVTSREFYFGIYIILHNIYVKLLLAF